MKISYVNFSFPSRNTFTVPQIGMFVQRYLSGSKVSIDPFARNFGAATYRNDLNPDTLAEYHMDSVDFLRMLIEKGIEADLCIFDPPFSPRQLKECYSGIGRSFTQEDGQRTASWKAEKDLIGKIIVPGGYALSFGWNSIGFGLCRGYRKEEIMLVCHGPGHNDTICLAEQKIWTQEQAF